MCYQPDTPARSSRFEGCSSTKVLQLQRDDYFTVMPASLLLLDSETFVALRWRVEETTLQDSCFYYSCCRLVLVIAVSRCWHFCSYGIWGSQARFSNLLDESFKCTFPDIRKYEDCCWRLPRSCVYGFKKRPVAAVTYRYQPISQLERKSWSHNRVM